MYVALNFFVCKVSQEKIGKVLLLTITIALLEVLWIV